MEKKIEKIKSQKNKFERLMDEVRPFIKTRKLKRLSTTGKWHSKKLLHCSVIIK